MRRGWVVAAVVLVACSAPAPVPAPPSPAALTVRPPVAPPPASAPASAPASVALRPAPPPPRPAPPPKAEAEEDGEPIKGAAAKRAAIAKAIVSRASTKVGNRVLPGPCYQTRRHAAIINGLALTKGKDAFPMDMESPEVDLDGDGTPDEMLFVDAANITSRYELYVRRGACGYHIGAIVTEAGPVPTEHKTNGLFDLEGDRVCRHVCCPDTVRYRYVFNGRRYVLSKSWRVTVDCNKLGL